MEIARAHRCTARSLRRSRSRPGESRTARGASSLPVRPRYARREPSGVRHTTPRSRWRPLCRPPDGRSRRVFRSVDETVKVGLHELHLVPLGDVSSERQRLGGLVDTDDGAYQLLLRTGLTHREREEQTRGRKLGSKIAEVLPCRGTAPGSASVRRRCCRASG